MKNNYYAIITANVRYDKRLTPNAKLMYGEITALTNHKGYAWASNSYFANLYEVNTKTVSRWINQLVKYEYIKTNLIYKKGTKQVEQRQMFINDTPMDNIVEGYGQESLGGMDNIVDSPMDKKMEDSTTSTNTTLNTTGDKTAVIKDDTPYTEIIEHLNQKTGKKFQTKTPKTRSDIRGRLNDGYTLEDFKTVIDNKVSDWIDDEKMNDYIRPQTLFIHANFESYLNQMYVKPKPKSGQVTDFEALRKGSGNGEGSSNRHIGSNTKKLY